MKTLKNFNFQGKKVLLRVDFNVPINGKGKILDDFRIRQTLPTIEYLIEKGAQLLLISHLGEPGGKFVEKFSLRPIALRLEKLLNRSVKFLDDCIGGKVEKEIKKMKTREIVLLENLRFYKEEEEFAEASLYLTPRPALRGSAFAEASLYLTPRPALRGSANDEDFAKKLAKLADIYINDAFGTCHRLHASIVGIPKHLPSAAGLLLEKEIKILSQALRKPWRPLVAIIGGVKISSKIKAIEKFLEKADHLLLGGEIANAILATKGILLGQPLPEPEVIKKIEKIDLTCPKLHLPVDVLVSLADLETGLKEGYFRQGGPGQIKKEEKGYDIGPETIKIFSKIIKEAKMIFWSGSLGMFEKEQFGKGTKEIAQIVTRNHLAFKIAGGGDTVLALNKFGLFDKFDYISTGGGAMLEFLAGKKLPGLKALE